MIIMIVSVMSSIPIIMSTVVWGIVMSVTSMKFVVSNIMMVSMVMIVVVVHWLHLKY